MTPLSPQGETGFLRDRGRSMRPDRDQIETRGLSLSLVRRKTSHHQSLAAAPPACSCTAIAHHHPQTANLCTAPHCVFGLCALGPGRDDIDASRVMLTF